MNHLLSPSLDAPCAPGRLTVLPCTRFKNKAGTQFGHPTPALTTFSVATPAITSSEKGLDSTRTGEDNAPAKQCYHCVDMLGKSGYPVAAGGQLQPTVCADVQSGKLSVLASDSPLYLLPCANGRSPPELDDAPPLKTEDRRPRPLHARGQQLSVPWIERASHAAAVPPACR